MIPAHPGPAGALWQPPVPAGPISSLGFIQNHTEEATSRRAGYLLNFPRIYRSNSQFRYSQWKLEWYQIYFQFLWQPRHGVRGGRVGRELWVPSGWSPKPWDPPGRHVLVATKALLLPLFLLCWCSQPCENDFWELCCPPGAGSDGWPQSQVTSVLPLVSSSPLRSWTPPQSQRNTVPPFSENTTSNSYFYSCGHKLKELYCRNVRNL